MRSPIGDTFIARPPHVCRQICNVARVIKRHLIAEFEHDEGERERMLAGGIGAGDDRPSRPALERGGRWVP
jgi:hypothetical protein